MKFRSVRIEGFGTLVDREFEFSPGLTLLVGRNEAGKSTLQKCLLALLYGLSRRGEGRGGPVDTSEWACLRPWDETAQYAASGRCVLKSGQEIFIAKDFGRQDLTNAQVVAGGKDITAALGRSKTARDLRIGEHFLGLPREEFEASALIKQYDVRWKGGSCKPLASRIEVLVDTAGRESASEAIRIIEKTISEKVGTALSTTRPLDRVGEELTRMRRELDECEAAHAEAMEAWGRIDELEARLERERGEVRNYEALARLGELMGLEEKVKRIREAEEEVGELRERLMSLGPGRLAEAESTDVTQAWTGHERRAGELGEVLSQLDEARTGLSKSTGELRSVAGGLWRTLVDLELLEGQPPELDGLGADELCKEIGGMEAALEEGTDAEQKRRKEIGSRLRKEQLRRVFTSSFVTLIGLAVAFGGAVGAKAAAVVGGALLLVAGVAGLVSVPILRRKYVQALSKLPDLDEMQAQLEEFRRARAKIDSQLDWMSQLVRRENEARDRREEAETALENVLRRAGAEGKTLEELKEAHAELQSSTRQYDAAGERLKVAARRLEELTADGGGEELARRADEARSSLSDIEYLRQRYSRGERYVDREREAREREKDLEAELEGLRREAQGLLRRTTPPGKLRSDIARLRVEEARLVSFRDSLEIARNVLASAVEGTHSRWSKSLNQAASEMVETMTQGRYSVVMFGNDLSPALERPDGHRIIEGQLLTDGLSEGTQDLLYLAARLAIARELSSSREPLPLILDDPLVAFDEDRLGQALSLLSKMARRVQVIVLTCREEYEQELRPLCQSEGVSFACLQLG